MASLTQNPITPAPRGEYAARVTGHDRSFGDVHVLRDHEGRDTNVRLTMRRRA